MLESPDGGSEELSARMDLVAKQAVQIQSSAKTFAAAAGKGFHIEPEAAATLINSCQNALTDLTGLDEQLQTAGQAPRLGQSPGAKVVGPFTQNAATDAHGIERA
ncbi:MAG TPA: hypothetical protein VFX16_29865, partial [Pseudonocardiaceae bacterium]|nr:hypothetical protein [Pseudonocardiaceae bacterium]